MRSDASSSASPGSAQWLAALAADRRDGLDQRDQLGDVVAVAAGGDCRERDEVRCASTIRWCLLPALPRSTGHGLVAVPPLITRMWLESTAREKSSRSAARSSDSSSSCRRCRNPALFQSCSRRPQVIPEPKPSSWGRNSRRIRRTARTGPRTAPCDHPDAHDLNAADYAGRRAVAATIRAHNSSSISHGLAAVFPSCRDSRRPARRPHSGRRRHRSGTRKVGQRRCGPGRVSRLRDGRTAGKQLTRRTP